MATLITQYWIHCVIHWGSDVVVAIIIIKTIITDINIIEHLAVATQLHAILCITEYTGYSLQYFCRVSYTWRKWPGCRERRVLNGILAKFATIQW